MEVRVQPPGIDEDGVKEETPEETVRKLSQMKARAGTDSAKAGEIVVAADTVVALDGKILGKPRDAAEAGTMLTMLSGRSHSVYTGLTVWDSATGQGVTDVEETEVEFRNLSASEIEAYVATGDPMDKAGGYGVQTGNLVKQVRGSLSNVAGLPMEKLRDMLSLLDS
jgi:septum formation protein